MVIFPSPYTFIFICLNLSTSDPITRKVRLYFIILYWFSKWEKDYEKLATIKKIKMRLQNIKDDGQVKQKLTMKNSIFILEYVLLTSNSNVSGYFYQRHYSFTVYATKGLAWVLPGEIYAKLPLCVYFYKNNSYWRWKRNLYPLRVNVASKNKHINNSIQTSY